MVFENFSYKIGEYDWRSKLLGRKITFWEEKLVFVETGADREKSL